MFTGIIESTGKVLSLEQIISNLNITIASDISSTLKIDQSVSHNVVCLTVIETKNNTHTVTAINETLNKSNLGNIKLHDTVNLERCLKIGDRLDGHMVQGHVDTTANLMHVEEENGSFVMRYSFDVEFTNLVVEKGSICLNGISLTLFDVNKSEFSVAIIPYTWENTNLQFVRLNEKVNIEFDVIGKYVNRIMGK